MTFEALKVALQKLAFLWHKVKDITIGRLGQ